MYWLNLLFALICLAVVIIGTGTLIHMRGCHEHPADCKPCIWLYRFYLVNR